ncbi:MAG: Nudix family hydrolase [Endozoicomonas sp.]
MPNIELKVALMNHELAERKVIHVAVGVILGEDGRILLAKRPDDKHMGGLWEFPGGKVEVGETVKSALRRELKEELDIDVKQFRPLICIRYNYCDKNGSGKTVLLDTWVVSDISGIAKGNEGQTIEWVEQKRLEEYTFPEANQAILTALALPNYYMITGTFENKKELFQKVLNSLESGIRLIQFRAHWLEKNEYLELARELSEMVKHKGGILLLKGALTLLNEPWCQGIHLMSCQLDEGAKLQKTNDNQLLAASCHNEQQILMAQVLGVDFLSLSPIKMTTTHPEAKPLGYEEASGLTAKSVVPVYWLGGMSEENFSDAQQCGAQGIAAINAFWRFL